MISKFPLVMDAFKLKWNIQIIIYDIILVHPIRVFSRELRVRCKFTRVYFGIEFTNWVSKKVNFKIELAKSRGLVFKMDTLVLNHSILPGAL